MKTALIVTFALVVFLVTAGNPANAQSQTLYIDNGGVQIPIKQENTWPNGTPTRTVLKYTDNGGVQVPLRQYGDFPNATPTETVLKYTETPYVPLLWTVDKHAPGG